jgi:hypothetical protein
MRRWAHWNWFIGLAALLSISPAAVRADLKEDVDKAVDRGVAYLKSQQTKGQWIFLGHELGTTALAGLTLLECGVARDDPLITQAADVVRAKCIHITKTYEIALAIMFLDRLGSPVDVPFIESLTVRLLAGQTNVGGWSYFCPESNQADVNRLLKHFKQVNEMEAGDKIPKEPKKKKPREPGELPKEILEQLQMLNRPGAIWAPDGPGDNSNTQFATLALWIARRQGLPVERALDRIEARFRHTQDKSGGWGYLTTVPAKFLPKPPQELMPINPGGRGAFAEPTAAMTCAGLVGLAVGHGAAAEKGLKKDLMKDNAVKAGLMALSTAIGNPGDAAKLKAKGPGPEGLQGVGGKSFYFLWSLERVGVIYGLDTIGKKDWYTWGAELLVATQAENGSWVGEFAGGGVDTCFALLFLRRANLAPDLTATLKGRIQDPAEVALKVGGVGADKLLQYGKGLKPGIVGKTSSKEKTTGAKEVASEKKTLPEPAIDAEIAQMSVEFAKASPAKQEDLLATWRDTKGGKYTEALAAAIALLKGPSKTKAREALAKRLTRMTAKTLRAQLEDEDLEIRRAAAIATGMKKAKELIPELIKLLDDAEMPVTQAALTSLREMTGQDFGPDSEATRAERLAAVNAWKSWWKKHGGTP